MKRAHCQRERARCSSSGHFCRGCAAGDECANRRALHPRITTDRLAPSPRLPAARYVPARAAPPTDSDAHDCELGDAAAAHFNAVGAEEGGVRGQRLADHVGRRRRQPCPRRLEAGRWYLRSFCGHDCRCWPFLLRPRLGCCDAPRAAALVTSGRRRPSLRYAPILLLLQPLCWPLHLQPLPLTQSSALDTCTGHGRFESVASLAIGSLLLAAGASFGASAFAALRVPTVQPLGAVSAPRAVNPALLTRCRVFSSRRVPIASASGRLRCGRRS